MRTGFILDASMAMAWCFPDEGNAKTTAILDRMEHETAFVPALWYIEITNTLSVAERKRRISAEKIVEFIELIEGFNLEVDTDVSRRSFSHLLPLCRSYALSAYDAVYLELSMRKRLPLATLDAELQRAAGKAGVDLLT